MSHRDKCFHDARDRQQAGARPDPVWLDARSIFAGRDEVLIRHGNQVYRLRMTRFGRLILTK